MWDSCCCCCCYVEWFGGAIPIVDAFDTAFDVRSTITTEMIVFSRQSIVLFEQTYLFFGGCDFGQGLGDFVVAAAIGCVAFVASLLLSVVGKERPRNLLLPFLFFLEVLHGILHLRPGKMPTQLGLAVLKQSVVVSVSFVPAGQLEPTKPPGAEAVGKGRQLCGSKIGSAHRFLEGGVVVDLEGLATGQPAHDARKLLRLGVPQHTPNVLEKGPPQQFWVFVEEEQGLIVGDGSCYPELVVFVATAAVCVSLPSDPHASFLEQQFAPLVVLVRWMFRLAAPIGCPAVLPPIILPRGSDHRFVAPFHGRAIGVEIRDFSGCQPPLHRSAHFLPRQFFDQGQDHTPHEVSVIKGAPIGPLGVPHESPCGEPPPKGIDLVGVEIGWQYFFREFLWIVDLECPAVGLPADDALKAIALGFLEHFVDPSYVRIASRLSRCCFGRWNC